MHIRYRSRIIIDTGTHPHARTTLPGATRVVVTRVRSVIPIFGYCEERRNRGRNVSLTTKESDRPSDEMQANGGASSSGILHSVQRYPAFRLLMTGTLASNTAFWMYQVAVGWLALQMTDSPFFVGMAGFAGGIPLLLFALPAGVIIDRFDRRRVLLTAQVGVMLVAAPFALMVGTRPDRTLVTSHAGSHLRHRHVVYFSNTYRNCAVACSAP